MDRGEERELATGVDRDDSGAMAGKRSSAAKQGNGLMVHDFQWEKHKVEEEVEVSSPRVTSATKMARRRRAA